MLLLTTHLTEADSRTFLPLVVWAVTGALRPTRYALGTYWFGMIMSIKRFCRLSLSQHKGGQQKAGCTYPILLRIVVREVGQGKVVLIQIGLHGHVTLQVTRTVRKH